MRGESVFRHTGCTFKTQENLDLVRRVATDFLSENNETTVQNKSRRQENAETVEEHIDSGQGGNDDGDVDDNHENEVLISVNVTSADDEIQLQDEENQTTDDMIPHGDGEKYTHHPSTKGVTEETIQITTQSEAEINPPSALLENQEQPLHDSDITAGTCLLNGKDNQKAGNHSLQTKLGKAVETVLGCTKEVEQFDKLRSRLKSNKQNSFLYEKYMNELANIQTKVLNKHNSLKIELKDWEKLYFIENNFRSPTQHCSKSGRLNLTEFDNEIAVLRYDCPVTARVNNILHVRLVIVYNIQALATHKHNMSENCLFVLICHISSP